MIRIDARGNRGPDARTSRAETPQRTTPLATQNETIYTYEEAALLEEITELLSPGLHVLTLGAIKE